MFAAFAHGFILAIGLIMPLGVQNFFVFTQGAVRRFGRALPIVIAAGVCDTLLIALAVSGVSVVVLHFEWTKTLLVVLGFLFLLYMGYQSWRSKPETSRNAAQDGAAAPRLIGYTVMISLLNPHALLDTIGLIGTSSLGYSGSEKAAFTGACILVSWIWFLFLAAAGHVLGARDASGRLVGWLNKASAVVMWAAAVYLLLSL